MCLRHGVSKSCRDGVKRKFLEVRLWLLSDHVTSGGFDGSLAHVGKGIERCISAAVPAEEMQSENTTDGAVCGRRAASMQSPDTERSLGLMTSPSPKGVSSRRTHANRGICPTLPRPVPPRNMSMLFQHQCSFSDNRMYKCENETATKRSSKLL